LLATLLNAKRCCFWCRVFCESGTLDDHMIDKLRQFDRIPIRIDYFVDGQPPSAFRERLPGICRVFDSFDNPEVLSAAAEIAASDCARSFGFQCKVNVKCGPNFRATCDGDRPTLPVIGSSRACVPFIVQIARDAPVGFQAAQVLAHVHVWDPPTNTLKKCTNVLNADFAVSDDTARVLSSASPSALFDYFARHGQLSLVDSLRTDLDNLRPLADLHARSANPAFPSFCSEVFDLCPPTVWRYVLGGFADVWRDEEGVQAVILKKFPVLLFGVGHADPLIGHAVREFVDVCRPLSVSVQQRPVAGILALAEELPGLITVFH
jgi:hypothetical protein